MIFIAGVLLLSNFKDSFGLRLRSSDPDDVERQRLIDKDIKERKDLAKAEEMLGNGNFGSCVSSVNNKKQTNSRKIMSMSSKEPFEEIYKSGAWSGSEETTLSGTGSRVEVTQVACGVLGAAVHRILNEGKLNVSILDAPMGDFFWQPSCLTKLSASLPDGAHVSYKGVDIASTAVKRAEAERRSINSIKSIKIESFAQLDLAAPHSILENFGTFDIILCNDALMHNSRDNLFKVLQNFNEAAKYLVVNTYAENPQNADILTGEYRRLDLTSAPYNFSPLCGDREHIDLENNWDTGEFIVTYALPLPFSLDKWRSSHKEYDVKYAEHE